MISQVTLKQYLRVQLYTYKKLAQQAWKIAQTARFSNQEAHLC